MESELGAILIIIIVVFVYFIPSWLAWNKSNADAVIAINFFLGWTFVGWVIALAMAYSPTPEKPTIIKKESDKYDKLAKLKKLLDGKAISEEEYNSEKDKILGKEKVYNPGESVDL